MKSCTIVAFDWVGCPVLFVYFLLWKFSHTNQVGETTMEPHLLPFTHLLQLSALGQSCLPHAPHLLPPHPGHSEAHARCHFISLVYISDIFVYLKYVKIHLYQTY